jgi:phosphoesterase RecJ-like protein
VKYYPTYARAFAEFRQGLAGQRVVVIGHQRPDGDCIGSEVAMCRLLRADGLDAVCMNPDPVPRRLKFLVGDTPFFKRDDLPDHTRLAVFTDCADHDRSGIKVRELYPAPYACFDHHLSNVGFAKCNFVDPESAATAEMLAGLALDAGLKIDHTTAQALYTGVMTDTGQFCFASTSERVFRICADLTARGADPAQAGMELYERETSGKLKLLQHFIDSLKFECHGRICVGTLPNGIFEKLGASVEDTEGLVDYARSVDGVEIGVLIEERPGAIKASLRAKHALYRMDTVAQQFGGGGHASAAGLNFPDNLAHFYPRLIAALSQRLVEVDAAKK